MKIIKRNGSIQEFHLQKIETSIIRASDDVEEPLNEGDVKFVLGRIESIIKTMRSEGDTSAYEVFAITIHVLNESGFNHIAENYYKGREVK